MRFTLPEPINVNSYSDLPENERYILVTKPVAAWGRWWHHYHMSQGANRSAKVDPLDQSPAAEPASYADQNSLAAQRGEPKQDKPPTYQLPRNLPSALSHLDDDQLVRLLGAVNVELERRGKKAPIQQTIVRKCSAEETAPPLAFGKLNAIRAAFKAGVKPSAIAKQFGVPQADVHRALKNEGQKR